MKIVSNEESNIYKVTDDFFGDRVQELLGKLTNIDGSPYEPTDAQVPLLCEDKRFQVWLMGRRSGKSTTAAIKAIIELCKPNKRIWIVAPSYQLTEKIYRMVYNYTTRCLPYMIMGQPKNSKNEMSLKFITGSEVVCKSAENPDSLVGDSLDLAIVDEAAIVRDLAIDYLLPALNDINPATGEAKGRLIAVSTPRQHNWFYTMHNLGKLSEDEQIARFKKVLYSTHEATSYSNAKHIDVTAIEAEKKRMPEKLWEQEYLARFQEEGGIVFSINRQRHFFPPGFRSVKNGHRTFIGVDLGKANDFTVMTAFNGRLEMIGYQRLNAASWTEITQKVKSFIEAFAEFGPITACIDETGVGAPVYDDLKRYFDSNFHAQVLPINFSRGNSHKNHFIEDLILAIDDDLIKFWDMDEIYEEFRDYAYTQTKDGRIVYAAPAKKHDDIVTSVALAYHATKRGNPELHIVRI